MTPHSPGLLPVCLHTPPRALLWPVFVFSVSIMFYQGSSSLFPGIFIYSKRINDHLYFNDFQIFTLSPGNCFSWASCPNVPLSSGYLHLVIPQTLQTQHSKTESSSLTNSFPGKVVLLHLHLFSVNGSIIHAFAQEQTWVSHPWCFLPPHYAKPRQSKSPDNYLNKAENKLKQNFFLSPENCTF